MLPDWPWTLGLKWSPASASWVAETTGVYSVMTIYLNQFSQKAGKKYYENEDF